MTETRTVCVCIRCMVYWMAQLCASFPLGNISETEHIALQNSANLELEFWDCICNHSRNILVAQRSSKLLSRWNTNNTVKFCCQYLLRLFWCHAQDVIWSDALSVRVQPLPHNLHTCFKSWYKAPIRSSRCTYRCRMPLKHKKVWIGFRSLWPSAFTIHHFWAE